MAFSGLLLMALATPPLIDWQVQDTRPHDGDIFTQGLQFGSGGLYESGGGYGRSVLVRYSDDMRRINWRRRISGRYFAEGLTLVGDELRLLSWRAGVMLRFDAATLAERKPPLRYDGEGWGLAWDGEHLIISDGSAVLRFVEPGALAVRRRLQVVLDGEPLDRLNELEYLPANPPVLLANRWQDERIYSIDPATGEVSGIIDLAPLAADEVRGGEQVLNGIAWHGASGLLWVTGKNWRQLYALRLYMPGLHSGASGVQ